MATVHAGAQMSAVSSDQRRGTVVQGLLLLLGSCLPVLGAVLVAPLLPQIAAEFAATPNAQVLVPLVIGAPALLIALLSPFAGAIADRFGRKPLLLVSFPIYAAIGIAPIFLHDLTLIVASRFALGAAEALIMTCCTALIGDYYHGATRARMLALQTIAASVGAVLFVLVGGALGEQGWRTPFWLYASALVFLPLAALVLWEPLKADAVAQAPKSKLPVGSLAVICALTFVGAIGFYIVPSQIAYMLALLGSDSPSVAGMANGAAQFSVLIGATSFMFIRKIGMAWTLALAFLLSGIGMIGMGLARDQQMLIGAGALNGFGVGLLLPCTLNWGMSLLTLEQRGRGAGAYGFAFFLGQFVCPVLLAGLSAQVGGLPQAVLIVGGVTAAFALVTLLARFAVTAKPIED